MTRERDLLEKVISGDNKGDFFVSYDLYKEIYEFLAQPEEEGVYQKLLRIEKENYVEMLPSELWLDGYETGKRSALLSKQPEQEPVAWMLIDKETGARIPKAYKPEHGVNKDRWELYPLHTTLPKREPLSDEEICEILLKKEWKGFVELVRIIEKAHGIGGEE